MHLKLKIGKKYFCIELFSQPLITNTSSNLSQRIRQVLVEPRAGDALRLDQLIARRRLLLVQTRLQLVQLVLNNNRSNNSKISKL